MTEPPQLDLLPEDENSEGSVELPTQQWVPEDAQDTSDDPLPETYDLPDEKLPTKNFEDLTLSQAVGLLLRMPQQTLDRFIAVANAPKDVPTTTQIQESALQPRAGSQSAAGGLLDSFDFEAMPRPRMSIELVQFVLYCTGFLFAWLGTRTMISGGVGRSEPVELAASIPFVVLGFLTWLAAEIIGNPPALLLRILQRENEIVQETPISAETALVEEKSKEFDFSRTLPIRAFCVLLGLLTSVFALTGNLNNHFTTLGVVAWLSSVLLWCAALAPTSWYDSFVDGSWIKAIERRVRGFRLRGNWTLLVLVAIIALGAYFRLNRLAEVPREMTSDHVEKILDSARVLDGVTQVFFPNNGGREPVQMYLMASLSQFPGLGMNFTTLKLLTAIEGILTLPLLWWFGREIVGRDNRQLGNVVGLCLAGLVAVSSWHEILSRMGLRIVLTVTVTTLLLIYLTRGIRSNNRGDFIKAGLILGFGLYAYQAVRMLPVVVVVGVGLAFIAAKTWQARGQLLVNLASLVLIAFIAFVPLFGFSLQSPDDFWRRTAGRLLGDDVIETTDAAGNIVQVRVPLEDRIAAFQANVPVLMDNIRNALLMFNWKGDVAWISNVPNNPEMDALTGAFFIVGLAAWLTRMFRRRDPADWLMPAALFIMLLPSALSIAYTVENPSATRTSGTMPTSYLFAALPLAMIAMSGKRLLPEKFARGMLVIVPTAVILLAYATNSYNFFEYFNNTYLISSLPYSEVGASLRGFAESDGSYGNAFMVGYPYWWDHRAIGIEAGRTDWPNGIDTNIIAIPDFIREAYECRSGEYQLNPDRDLVFFTSPADEATRTLLTTWFPDGYGSYYSTYQIDDSYYFYRVPRLGAEALQEFLDTYSTAPQC